jgi:hypothetical protein
MPLEIMKKRFEVGRNSEPFKTFSEWLGNEIPESRKWISRIEALVITRGLLGDTVCLVTQAPAPNNWSKIADAISGGLEAQCGIRPFEVECASKIP